MRLKRTLGLVLAMLMLTMMVAGCATATATTTTAATTAATTKAPTTTAAATTAGVTTAAPAVTTAVSATKPYMLAPGKKIKIGWSCHFWNPFNTGMDKYIQDTVKKLSEGRAEVITVGANGDAVKQIADIESLIQQKVDFILIKAQDLTTCANVLGEARAAGIKVILLQRRMNHSNYDYYVGSNFITTGADMGKEILKKFPNGNFNYCFMEGSATGANDLDTLNGCEKVFKDSGLPGIKKLAGMNTQILRAESKKGTEDWITAYGDKIDIIMSTADELRIGVEQALAESNLKKKVYTTGVNTVTECLDSVKNGQCLYTAAISPGVFPGLELIMALANGQGDKFPHKDIEIPVIAITPDNVMQYYDAVKKADLYMLGLLQPAVNPLFTKLPQQGFPELVQLLHE